MTLRKIAEEWHKADLICRGYHAHQGCRPNLQKNIVTLLDVLVEERAKFIAATDEDIEITLRQAKKKALRELGLDKVWPPKEKKA